MCSQLARSYTSATEMSRKGRLVGVAVSMLRITVNRLSVPDGIRVNILSQPNGTHVNMFS